MARITYFPNRVVDSDGIADGASIYVYQTGTTTPVSLYSDSGLVTPVANPYVVAAGGEVPPLYHGFAGDIRLRVVSDSGDVTDTDPYPTFVSDGDITLSDIEVSGNDKVLGRVTAGAGGIEEITCTAAGRALLDDASASAQRTTLGLATVAATGAFSDMTGEVSTAQLPDNQTYRTIQIVLDGGGSAITTGLKGFIEVPYAGTITGWTLMADQSGSIVIDIWKDTYANFPPSVADTITASDKPTLSSAQTAQDLAPTGWTTSVAVGDILAFNVDSITTVTRVTLSLRITTS